MQIARWREAVTPWGSEWVTSWWSNCSDDWTFRPRGAPRHTQMSRLVILMPMNHFSKRSVLVKVVTDFVCRLRFGSFCPNSAFARWWVVAGSCHYQRLKVNRVQLFVRWLKKTCGSVELLKERHLKIIKANKSTVIHRQRNERITSSFPNWCITLSMKYTFYLSWNYNNNNLSAMTYPHQKILSNDIHVK